MPPHAASARIKTGGWWALRLSPLASALVVAASCATAPQPPAVKHYLSGHEFSMQDFHGHVTLLNFWAMWCKPCLKEIPALAKLADDSHGTVVYVAVYYEPESVAESKLTPWLRVQPDYFAHQVAWGNGALLKQFPHRLLPTTYVIGTNGVIVRSFVGSLTTDAQLSELRVAIETGLHPPYPVDASTPTAALQ